MEANKDEALKCFKMAKSAMARQDYQKALKLATKANNMFPCQEYEDFIEKCSAKISQETSQESARSRTNNETYRHQREETNSEPSSRRSTDEQDNLCKKIVNSKNYYEMLGVSKTDSVEKIKKAYKKEKLMDFQLALKLHPDKNPSPLASEAFKKVSTAFQCLTNPKAREDYDLYGEEGRTFNHNRYQQEFVTPEQLFEAFFGMNHHNNVFHFTTTHTHSHNSNRNRITLAQFIPLLILLALILFSNLMSHGGEVYSFQKNSKYTKMLSTAANGVVYYVEPRSFEYNYPPRTAQRVKIEYEIDYKFYHEKCNNNKKENQRLIYSYLSSMKNPPKELYETPKSCEVLEELRDTYTKIIQSYEF